MNNKYKIHIPEEDIYMFILLLFVGRACSLTSLNDIRENIIGTALLCLPALHLIWKRKLPIISNKLLLIYAVLGVWTFLHHSFDDNFKFLQYFNVFFHVTIGYFVILIYGRRIYKTFEKIIVLLTGIDLALWVITLLVGANTIASFGLFEPTSSTSMASFLIYNVADVSRYENQGIGSMLRNCGFCWEPGLFACIVSVGLYFNLLLHKKFNKGTAILLAGVFSTFSTTGYVTVLLILANHYVFQQAKGKGVKRAFGSIVIALIIAITFSLSFMSGKIRDNFMMDNFISMDIERLSYMEKTGQKETVQRLEGLYLDYLNFKDKPWIGYGNAVNSYVTNEISDLLNTSNGLMKTFARFGIFLGMIFFVLWYINAGYIDKLFGQKYRMFFIIMIMISVSYSFTVLPLMLALNNQILFVNNKNKSFRKRIKHAR